MEPEWLYLQCRSCLQSAGTISLSDKDENMSYSEMFMICTSVAVLPGETGPEKLCKICLYRLRDAFLFRNQCLQSDTRIKDLFTLKQENLVDRGKDEIDVEDFLYQGDEDNISVDDDDKLTKVQNIKTEELTDVSSNNKVTSKVKLKRKGSCKRKRSTDIKEEKDDTAKHKKSRKTLADLFLSDVKIAVKKTSKKMKKETEEKHYFCDVCTFSTKSKYSLINHIRNHTGEKPFKCETCNKGYSSRMSLNYHVKSCQKASVCDVCGKLYKAMEYHRLMHSTEKAHHCNICVAAFNTKQQLNQHIKWHNKDSRVRNHQCSTCPKSFFKMSALNDHMKIHNSDRELHPCGICHRTYYSRATLATHIKRHTMVKNFICDECSKGFYSKDELRSHIGTHIGKKSFGCEECGKTFVHKYSLTSHMISHTKTKNYVCDICNQRFARNSSLHDHRKKKHNIQSNRISDAIYCASTM